MCKWRVFFALFVCVPLEQCHERTTPRCPFFKKESDEALLPQPPPPTSERRCARLVLPRYVYCDAPGQRERDEARALITRLLLPVRQGSRQAPELLPSTSLCAKAHARRRTCYCWLFVFHVPDVVSAATLLLQVPATRCRLVCCARCLTCTASWFFRPSKRRPGVAPRAALCSLPGPVSGAVSGRRAWQNMHRKLQEQEPAYLCFVRSL